MRRGVTADDVPRGVALVHDFANTLDERVFRPHALRTEGRDMIAERTAFDAWLGARGLATGASPNDVALARMLRTALRAAIRSTLQPHERPAATTGLDAIAERLPLAVRLGTDGRPVLRPLTAGVPGALAAILGAAVDAAARDTWTRLKMCSADDCRWVFYDASKPRTGRWCEMAVCGNRAKTRAYRQRREARPAR